MFTYFSVGSFVWSHLNNLKVSARSSQMEIQAMLQNTEFSAKFNKAYFKFSRNYESSIYINEYGVGMLFITILILFIIWIFQILITYPPVQFQIFLLQLNLSWDIFYFIFLNFVLFCWNNATTSFFSSTVILFLWYNLI